MNAAPLPGFLDPACGWLSTSARYERYEQRRPRPTVLIVDDDESIRQILVLGLSRYGFDVKTAGGGVEAIKLCDCRSPVQVALVDHQMPGMDGEATIDAITRAAPWIRCCIMSGDIAGYRSRVGQAAFIAKPFEMDNLADKLQELAEQPLC